MLDRGEVRAHVGRFLLAALAASAVTVGVLAGCEVAIGDALPAFTCTLGDVGLPVCPAGQVCSPGNLCVPAPTMTEEASTDGPEAEAPSADAPFVENGPCKSSAQCNGGVCLNKPEATSQLYAAAGSAPFCATTCCSSSECPTGTVCFATGQGANYCVNPAWLGRSPSVGVGVGGASCTRGSDCRSGLCGTGGHCADTCCSPAAPPSRCSSRTACASPTACVFGPFPGTGFDTHFVSSCLVPAGTQTEIGGQACSGDLVCRSGECPTTGGTSNDCADPCGNSAGCTAGSICDYFAGYSAPNTTTSDFAAMCLPPVGSKLPGEACSGPSDCMTNLCLAGSSGNVCSDVCFADCDCPAQLPVCEPMSLAGTNQMGNVQTILALVCGSMN